MEVTPVSHKMDQGTCCQPAADQVRLCANCDGRRTHFSLGTRRTQGVPVYSQLSTHFPFGHFLEMGSLDFSEHHDHPGALILSVRPTHPLPTLLFQTRIPAWNAPSSPTLGSFQPFTWAVSWQTRSQALEKTRESK